MLKKEIFVCWNTQNKRPGARRTPEYVQKAYRDFSEYDIVPSFQGVKFYAALTIPNSLA